MKRFTTASRINRSLNKDTALASHCHPDRMSVPEYLSAFWQCCLKIIPKVGPFKAVAFNIPSTQTEDMYLKSLDATIATLRSKSLHRFERSRVVCAQLASARY